jgi:hypothetical protein
MGLEVTPLILYSEEDSDYTHRKEDHDGIRRNATNRFSRA